MLAPDNQQYIWKKNLKGFTDKNQNPKFGPDIRRHKKNLPFLGGVCLEKLELKSSKTVSSISKNPRKII
jgi:hypothetical protein